ncbi:hypothetical protein [Echinicola vietnamensis]|uniref:Uncharacterized protein n=1 Tax=Echinicola vietnamensis (strain DSM 17526 / LMG 23754 / KMM 6221) TaxID=926556 RepID=L0G5N0_ECHVK|nr:hypothetical protein [Echinicola vietnamensis]AGA80145.1 hypothetical protein Echvi_3935 [Echinicola vietnamensis DSM 17526]
MKAGFGDQKESSNVHQNGDLSTEFYALGEHWRSDLAFYQDEIRFLKELMAGYFHHFLEDLDFNFSRKIENRLAILDRRREEVDDKVSRQLHEISQGCYTGRPVSREVFRRQEELEALVALFAKDFRILKKQIFRLTEDGLSRLRKENDQEYQGL